MIFQLIIDDDSRFLGVAAHLSFEALVRTLAEIGVTRFVNAGRAVDS